MGFFSWNCKECGHPMLCSAATEKKNRWMNEVVVIEDNGSILKGEYDGYGRVNDREIDFYAPQCYHHHCWEKAGCPTTYTGESKSARDQGWFFNDNVHNFSPDEIDKAKEEATNG